MNGPQRMGIAAVSALAVFITAFEGRVFEAHPDAYGLHAICAGYTQGVKPGDTATPEQCDELTLKAIRDAESVVLNAVPSLPVDLRPAFVSFVYNVGTGRAGLKDGFLVQKSGAPSTMLVLLKSGRYAAACDQILRFTKSDGRELKGLVKRRRAEWELCRNAVRLHDSPSHDVRVGLGGEGVAS